MQPQQTIITEMDRIVGARALGTILCEDNAIMPTDNVILFCCSPLLRILFSE